MKYFIEFSVAGLLGATISLLTDINVITGTLVPMFFLLGYYIPEWKSNRSKKDKSYD